MEIDELLNGNEEDLSDEELHALIMADRPLDAAILKNDVGSIKEYISRSDFYRLWDVVEARVKLGLAYYRLAHVDQDPKHYRKALNAFKYAWDTDYRYSECGREVLLRLINSCKDHLHVQALAGIVVESPSKQWTLPERAAESPRLVLCKACLGRWG
ncbi:MAG TPA: hypothetical protein VKK79_02570 [Candidatus Lokiarchaeia archaeon]|nr:hypothetical protein [Candidatus Lokiarchaeia archaeon]